MLKSLIIDNNLLNFRSVVVFLLVIELIVIRTDAGLFIDAIVQFLSLAHICQFKVDECDLYYLRVREKVTQR